MNKLFNHILVPVNFNRNSLLIVEKAIGIANEFRCDIHLLYNHSPALPPLFRFAGPASGHASNYLNPAVVKKMNGLVEKYRSQLNHGLSIDCTLITGNWFAVMKHIIITHHIDLVIIPRHTRLFLNEWLYDFNINRLARETDCPVLTITQGMDISHVKNIVVPINDFLPIRKLTTASYIARQFNAIIHLMEYKEDPGKEEPGDGKWVSRAYQLLNDHTHLKINRSPVYYGNSMAGNTLSYARQVNADLIVVNPGKESISGGWINHLLGRCLYKRSDIPILTIAPRSD
jgi:nucleotide-binding universal stress UspA family protein